MVCSLLLIYSCQTKDLTYSAHIVEKVEMKNWEKYCKNRHLTNNSWFKRTTDSLYPVYFNYRRTKVDKFIKEHKFKKFFLTEFYYIEHINNILTYVAGILTVDSVYYFRNNDGLAFLHKRGYGIVDSITKVRATGSIYYIKKKDSIFIYKNAAVKEYDLKKYPAYYSNYVNGKLDQLTCGDSIIYKRKGSKMVVDLQRLKGYYTDWKTGKYIYYP